MDLIQIRYFLALTRTLNFTRAAEECNVTQPAFTRAIQRLEGEMGGPLILRERARTQLSELGRVMLPLLQATNDAAEATRARAREHRRGADEAPLRLGLAPTIPAAGFAGPLREVAARVGDVRVTLAREPEPALVEMLLAGDLDLAVLPETAPLPARLNRWPLWSERVLVLMDAAHPLAAGRTVAVEALRGAALVAPALPHPAASALARLAEEHGIAAAGLHRAGCDGTAALLVAAGLGVGLVPKGMAVPMEGLVTRPLAEGRLSHPVVLCAAAGRPMNRAVGALSKVLRALRWEAGRAA